MDSLSVKPLPYPKCQNERSAVGNSKIIWEMPSIIFYRM